MAWNDELLWFRLHEDFTIGGPHLVVNGRRAGGAQRVDITQRALVLAVCLGNLFLSQIGTGHSQGGNKLRNLVDYLAPPILPEKICWAV